MSIEKPCFYHPDKTAFVICDKCSRNICVNDQRIYKKRMYGLYSTQRVIFNFCVICNANQFKTDAKSSLISYIIISILLIMIFLTTEYSNSDQLLILVASLVILLVLLFIPYYLIRIRSKKAEKEKREFIKELDYEIKLEI